MSETFGASIRGPLAWQANSLPLCQVDTRRNVREQIIWAEVQLISLKSMPLVSFIKNNPQAPN
jgi:hypothetical protein